MVDKIFGPLELPSGKKIKFRSAQGVDRVNVISMLKMSPDNMGSVVFLVDGYVAAKCITEVDGNKTDGDYKRLYDNMPEADLQFYQAVYTEMFGFSDDKRSNAKEAARFLLSGQTSTALSS